MTERHNHPRLHTLYNKGMGAAQENRNFIIKKLSDYLEVPNNLLLSHRRYRRNVTQNHFIICARGDPRKAFRQRIFMWFLRPNLYIPLRRFII